ncbi:MAG: hypothetical protein GVY35_00425 [Bacteroidetes bacterium]|jgi:YVTN family beta-propeller protein|nr:hypothetical protein [Bacteroidota bacterium]
MIHRTSRALASLAFSAVLLLAGCDLVGSEDTDTAPRTTGVIVGNSGNFSDQNGTLTLYNPRTRQARQATTLGAFLQTMRLSGDSLYVVTNTFAGGRVDVFDAATLSRTGQAISPSTPRAVAPATDDKAYVTNTSFSGGESFVALYDRGTGKFREATTRLPTMPADVLVTGGQAFVANYGSGGDGTTLSVIDVATDQVTSTTELGCDGPNELFLDAQDEIAVVCQGKTVYNEDFSEIIEQTNGQIVFVDAGSGAVISRIELDQQVGSANGTQSAYYAAASEELYVIDGTDTVLRFDTASNTAEGAVSVPSRTGLTGLTAVAYDAATQQLYVGRFASGAQGGPDYTSAGSVVVLNRDGSVATSFQAGPSPGHIVLRQEAR